MEQKIVRPLRKALRTQRGCFPKVSALVNAEKTAEFAKKIGEKPRNAKKFLVAANVVVLSL